MGRNKTAIAATVLAMCVSGAFAQSLTDEEILLRFNTQKDLFESATDGQSDKPKTRGLTIVTNKDNAAQGGTVAIEGTQTATDSFKPLAPKTTEVSFDPNISVDIQIEFDFDSAAISNSQQPALDQICRVMTQASDIGLFRIVGHTDSSGSDLYNERLSTLRAEEVGRHLVDICGISPTRLDMVGYGERFLAMPNDPEAAENRRVEFQALG
jgi:OOP family OmpA-OmpF porin